MKGMDSGRSPRTPSEGHSTTGRRAAVLAVFLVVVPAVLPSGAAAAATIPGAPTGLSAFGGNGQVGLGWNAPSSNGGATITSYRVFRGTNSSNTSIVTSGGCANLGAILGCTDTGLTNGQSYYYIVSAVNSAGQGPPSNGVTATPAAPVTIPATPTGLAPGGSSQPGTTVTTLTPTLTWNAPSGATAYSVAVSQVGGGTVLAQNVSTNSVTCPSLVNGATYIWAVSASNSAGSSATSAVVYFTVNVTTIPGAPTSLSAFGGNGQVGLGWNAPSSNGGAPITSYRVFRGTNSSNTSIVTSGGCASLGVALGCTDTGLTNGQSYYYIVSAVNSVGQGPPSNSATATPAAAVVVSLTGAAQCYSGTPGAHLSFTVSGGTFSTFDLYRGGSLLSPSNTGTTFDNYPLTVGSTYSYYVIVHLTGGGTATSNTASVTVASGTCATATIPGAPTSLSAFGGNGQVGLGWDAPSSNGGAAITSYRVFRGTNSSNTSIVTSGGCANLGAVLGCTDIGLTNGQSYYYIVSAVNSVGQGPPSSSATATPAAAAVVSLTGAAQCYSGSPGAHLSFTVSGGTSSTFDLYRGGSLLYPANSGTTFDNYPLTVGSTYSYYVIVHLTGGSTATSNTASVTVASGTCATATIPGAPTSLSAFGGNGQIGLGWNAPSSNGGAPITSYRVFRGTNSSNTLIVTSGGCASLGVALGCTDTGLTNGQSYYYIVSAVNSVGQGAPSNSATATPAAPALSITTTSPVPATATVGIPYAAQQAVAASGGQTPYNWSVSGLPNGMAINSSSGAIFGTPTVSGTFSFTVTVRDSSSPQQTASKVLSITVTQVLPPPTQPPPASTGLGATGTTTNRTVSVAEPVNTATGNYYNSLVDLTVPGKGLSFILTRSYNSQDSYSGPMGVGWTHSYNVYLMIDPTSGVVAVKQGDGHQEYYTPVGGGGYAPQTLGLFNTLEQSADGSFTLTFKNQSQFRFSAIGTLLTIADRNGNTQTLNHDASGHLTSVIDPSGRVFNLAYDGNGRMISLSDPLGRTLGYAYDSSGNLASFTDAMGLVTQYGYDASNRLNSATDPRGNVYMQNVYDSSGRVIQQMNARRFVTTFAYNTPSGGITSVTDPLGATTQYVYDSALRLSSVIAPDGAATSYHYDGNNLEMSWTDALGRTTNFAYDANGNVTSSTDAGGNTTTSLYDGQNDLLRTTDPLNRQATFLYDAKGNLLTASDAAGGTTTNTYDGSGLLLSTQNPLNAGTSFQYDTYGDRTRITDALGGVTLMTYDLVGRLLSTQDRRSKTWNRTYDADNHLISTTDPLGDRTSYTYDSNGNRTQSTDANGHATANGYDVNNNLVQMTDAVGQVTQYGFNANDDRTGITDAKGHTTIQAYDNLRRLHSRTDSLGHVQTYGYDAVGNRTSTIDGNGRTNTFTYDALNRRIGASLSDGKAVSYTYDVVGNRLTMVDWRGTTAYTYDLLNRITSVVGPDGNTVAFTYDLNGNRTSIHYPDGKVVLYQYDALNRLIHVTDWSSQTTTYTYDAEGHAIGVSNPNGTTTARTYDDAGRLVSVVNRSGGQAISSYQYVLDNLGNRREVASYNEGVERYVYDPLNRVRTWTSPSRQTAQYAYDNVGNRLSMVLPAGTVNYTYDAADQLLTAGGTAFTYDGNGNQVSQTAGGTTITYAWDAMNRMTSVTGGGANTQYQYDGDGNRVAQTNSTGTYIYANDVARSLPRVLNENGPDGNISYVHGSSVISASSATFQSYYQLDGLGSVVDVTDSSGSVKAAYSYDPWGSTAATVDLLGNKNKYRFAGEAVDPGVNLLYLRARYYDTTLGRFPSRDPQAESINVPGSYTRYGYAYDNPLQTTDPNGKCPWCISAAIGAVIGGTVNGVDYALNHQGADFSWRGFGADVAGGAVSGGIAGALALTPAALNPVGLMAIGAGSSAAGQLVINMINGDPLGQDVGKQVIIGGVLGPLSPLKTGATVAVSNLLRIAGNDLIGDVVGAVAGDWTDSWMPTPTPAPGIHK